MRSLEQIILLIEIEKRFSIFGKKWTTGIGTPLMKLLRP
ncbi:hypothetical protein C4K05_1974 [Pseudomonas chlororaphis subsp. aureofaciens]|nr:hypothetical protein C4K05_1974 [Pseudomonas chlororaphis subsp. aureofaciens]